MTDFSSVSIPPPKDWQAFERHARLLFEYSLGDPQTQNNGRQGQPQHGVDVFGRRGGGNGVLVGVQCKGKDSDYSGSVTVKELRAEVEKSAKFKPAIQEFILITTAPDDAAIQASARLLEKELRDKGREITIAVWGWGRVQQEIVQFTEVLKAFHPDASPFHDQLFNELKEIRNQLAKQARSQITPEQRDLTSIVVSHGPPTQIAPDTTPQSDALDKYLHDQIDTFRDYIRADRPQTAIDLLTKLKEQVWNTASPKIRFRILANIGAAHHRLAHYDVAANFFLEAAPLTNPLIFK